MKVINAMVALAGALGLYMIFLGIYSYISVALMARRRGLLDDDLGVRVPENHPIGISERLEQALYQARFEISVHEFITVSFFLGIATAGVLYFATGAEMAGVLGFLSGAALYTILLMQRRERNLELYEQAMPNMLRDMRSAFRLRGLSLTEALRHVAEKGPKVCRPDIQELVAAFSDISIDMARLQNLMGLRGSYALDRVVEVLLQFNSTPQRIPEILDLLIPRLRKEVAIHREMRANISGPRRELLVVAVMPFVIVVFFRVAAPEYAAFYRTFTGQILLITAWLIDVAVYLFAGMAVRRIVNPRPYHRGVPERRRVVAQNPDTSFAKVAGVLE